MKLTTKREMEAEQNRRLRLYYLHRECVRRSSVYARDFQSVLGITDSNSRKAREHELKAFWNLWPSDTLPVPDERIDLDEIKAGRFPASSQTLTGNLDVDQLENDASRKLTSRLLHPRIDDLRNLANDLKGFLFLLYFPEEQEEPYPAPWSLTVVDMRRPKNELMEFFKAWPKYKLTRRAANGLGQARPQVRFHIDEAYDYLKAYDLQQQGWIFRQIAEHLWPGARGEHLTRQAKSYCKKAEGLIATPPLTRLIREHVSARLGKK